jgi:hypothetical protein
MPPNYLRETHDAVEKGLAGVTVLEEAGQRFVETIYKRHRESIVLLRLFVTIPMSELSQDIQNFAQNLAQGAGAGLDSGSHVLTLLGTVGAKPNWNIRTRSKGHLGIPLATSDFVSAIPMLSALLEQLGFDLGWIRGEPEIMAQKMGSMSGTFHVAEASTDKDSKGRKIIAAQDFVEENGVRSVFGVGGGYTLVNKFMVMICFCRESLDKEQAISFQGFANTFKATTQDLVRDKSRFFK